MSHRRGLAGLLVLGLLVRPLPAAGADRAGDPELEAGIALVKEGDFEAAVLKLDAVTQRLAAAPGRTAELARAYLFLGVSYLELAQDQTARAKFREALRRDPGLRPGAREFSPQVIRAFEEARASTAAPPQAADGKKSRARVWLVVGGGVAAAGAFAATRGGGSATTSTTLPAGNTTTTTATTTTTTTVTTPTTTTTTTSTTLPSCQYTMSPPAQSISVAGGERRCDVGASRGCPWTAESRDAWIQILAGGSGSGNGTVTLTVLPNTGSVRTGTVRLSNDPGTRCEIRQDGVLGLEDGSGSAPVWSSLLDLPGGRGRIQLDGQLTVQERGWARGLVPGGAGLHRLEAELVRGQGRPGHWRFALPPGVEPDSVRVSAGEVLAVSAGSVVFRLAGQPGERLAFGFRLEQGGAVVAPP